MSALKHYLQRTPLTEAYAAFVDSVDTDFPAFDRPYAWQEAGKLDAIAQDLTRIAEDIQSLSYAADVMPTNLAQTMIGALDGSIRPEALAIMQESVR